MNSLAQDILNIACIVSLTLLVAAFLLTIWRIVRGPRLADRVLGLDLLVAIAIGFIAVIGVYTGYYIYLDIALALGLVGFLSTVAFARYIASAGYRENYLPNAKKPRQSEKKDHG